MTKTIFWPDDSLIPSKDLPPFPDAVRKFTVDYFQNLRDNVSPALASLLPLEKMTIGKIPVFSEFKCHVLVSFPKPAQPIYGLLAAEWPEYVGSDVNKQNKKLDANETFLTTTLPKAIQNNLPENYFKGMYKFEDDLLEEECDWFVVDLFDPIHANNAYLSRINTDIQKLNKLFSKLSPYLQMPRELVTELVVYIDQAISDTTSLDSSDVVKFMTSEVVKNARDKIRELIMNRMDQKGKQGETLTHLSSFLKLLFLQLHQYHCMQREETFSTQFLFILCNYKPRSVESQFMSSYSFTFSVYRNSGNVDVTAKQNTSHPISQEDPSEAENAIELSEEEIALQGAVIKEIYPSTKSIVGYVSKEEYSSFNIDSDIIGFLESYNYIYDYNTQQFRHLITGAPLCILVQEHAAFAHRRKISFDILDKLAILKNAIFTPVYYFAYSQKIIANNLSPIRDARSAVSLYDKLKSQSIISVDKDASHQSHDLNDLAFVMMKLATKQSHFMQLPNSGTSKVIYSPTILWPKEYNSPISHNATHFIMPGFDCSIKVPKSFLNLLTQLLWKKNKTLQNATKKDAAYVFSDFEKCLYDEIYKQQIRSLKNVATDYNSILAFKEIAASF